MTLDDLLTMIVIESEACVVDAVTSLNEGGEMTDDRLESRFRKRGLHKWFRYDRVDPHPYQLTKSDLEKIRRLASRYQPIKRLPTHNRTIILTPFSHEPNSKRQGVMH